MVNCCLKEWKTDLPRRLETHAAGPWALTDEEVSDDIAALPHCLWVGARTALNCPAPGCRPVTL